MFSKLCSRKEVKMLKIIKVVVKSILHVVFVVIHIYCMNAVW